MHFRRFSPIVGEKIGVVLKKQYYDIIIFFKKLALVWKKRQYCRYFFRRKYFKNHNIGPSIFKISANPSTIFFQVCCPGTVAFPSPIQGCQMVFFKPKIQIWANLECLRIENVGK
jgi:hypothetical protein